MGICVPGEVRWTLLTLLNFKIEFWSYLDRYFFWKVILYMTGDVLESSSGQSYYSEKRKKKDKSQNKTPLTAMLGCCSACAEGHVGGKPDLICMVTSSGPWILWRVLLPLLSGQGRWVTVAQNFAFVFYFFRQSCGYSLLSCCPYLSLKCLCHPALGLLFLGFIFLHNTQLCLASCDAFLFVVMVTYWICSMYSSVQHLIGAQHCWTVVWGVENRCLLSKCWWVTA